MFYPHPSLFFVSFLITLCGVGQAGLDLTNLDDKILNTNLSTSKLVQDLSPICKVSPKLSIFVKEKYLV